MVASCVWRVCPTWFRPHGLAVTAIRSARATVWERAGDRALGHGIDAGDPVIIDLDATLVTAPGP